MVLKRHIPNAITTGNLICGCISIVQIFQGNLTMASLFIWLAVLLDFLDGFTARVLKVNTIIGKDLDSLADLVTFGLAPTYLIYDLILRSSSIGWLPYISILIAVCSALRLAKFNVDTRQSSEFRGLPTPANALLISSFPFIAQYQNQYSEWLSEPLYLIIFVLASSFLLVSNLKLFTLKFVDYSWGNNKVKYIFLVLSMILFFVLKITSIPLIVILYVFLSIINNLLVGREEY